MVPGLILTTLLSVSSPNGLNTLKIARSGEALYYTVLRGEQVVLAPQAIALEVAGVGAFKPGKAVSFRRQLGGPVPLGTKRSAIDLEAVGARLDLGNGLSLEAVATDLGVAYRWLSALEGEAEVRSERFGLQPRPEAELFYGCEKEAWRGDAFQISWESPHQRSRVEGIEPGRLVYLPLTLVQPGCALAVSEAELRDYPGLNLRRPDAAAGALEAMQARWPLAQDGASRRFSLVTARADYLVRTAGTRAYPWRVFMMAGDLGELYANDLVMALSEPPEGDFS